MKHVRNIALAMLLLSAAACDGKGTLDIDFSVIEEGMCLIRDKRDKVYSAVAYDKAGLKDVLSQYELDITIPKDFFGKHILIVGFSDRSGSVTVDGLKHQVKPHSGPLYLDLHDKGVKLKVAPPPEGKKYSS